MFINNFGIEIEFGSSLPMEELAKVLDVEIKLNSIYYTTGHAWMLDHDQSAGDDLLDGVEILTPIFNVFPIDELSKICEELRRHVTITTTSGMHIHFSGPSFVGLEFLPFDKKRELSTRMVQLANPHIDRLRFCLPSSGAGNKQTAFRQIVDSHWECRVFNSTLDVDMIQKNFDTLNRVIGEYV